jgi:hypothetical protein
MFTKEPEIKEKIYNISDLINVPASLSCKKLRCLNCPYLVTIYCCEELTELDVYNCPKLRYIYASHKNKRLCKVSLALCPNIRYLPPYGESSWYIYLGRLSIRRCPKLQFPIWIKDACGYIEHDNFPVWWVYYIENTYNENHCESLKYSGDRKDRSLSFRKKLVKVQRLFRKVLNRKKFKNSIDSRIILKQLVGRDDVCLILTSL